MISSVCYLNDLNTIQLNDTHQLQLRVILVLQVLTSMLEMNAGEGVGHYEVNVNVDVRVALQLVQCVALSPFNLQNRYTVLIGSFYLLSFVVYCGRVENCTVKMAKLSKIVRFSAKRGKLYVTKLNCRKLYVCRSNRGKLYVRKRNCRTEGIEWLNITSFELIKTSFELFNNFNNVF